MSYSDADEEKEEEARGGGGSAIMVAAHTIHSSHSSAEGEDEERKVPCKAEGCTTNVPLASFFSSSSSSVDFLDGDRHAKRREG